MNKVQAAKTIIKLAKALATDSKSTRTAGAKYTLTDISTTYYGHTLYRIKYSNGKFGGFIESEKNLQGNAKLLDDSMVYGNAVVKDNAVVKGNSIIGENAIVAGHSKVDDCQINRYAIVSGSAKVTDSQIFDHAEITDRAVVNQSWIEEHAKVLKDGKVSNASYIGGKSQVFGLVYESTISGNSTIFGNVIHSQIYKNMVIKSNMTIKDQNIH